MEKIYNISLDTKQQLGYSRIEFVHGDVGSNKLNIKIYQDSVLLNLTGKTITLTIRKPDNTIVVYDITAISENEVQFIPDVNALASIGTVLCSVEIYEGVSRITTAKFQYYVLEELNTKNDIPSFDDYPILTKLISQNHDIQTAEDQRIIDENERKTSELGRQTAETQRGIDFNNSQTQRQATFEASEISRTNTFNTNESTRQTEFNIIKQDYDTYKNVMISESNVATLQNEINKTNTQLAGKAKQIDMNILEKNNKISTLVKNHIAKAIAGFSNAGALTILGDSITHGQGSSTSGKQYASIVRDTLFKMLKTSPGYEVSANFENGVAGFTYGGSYAFGTYGPVGKSIILQPGATITFTRTCKYVDVWYRATPTSGKIEIRQDGALFNTMDLSSASEKLNCSYPLGLTTYNDKESTFTITCINAPVELTGVITVSDVDTTNTFFFNRMAVPGYTTSNFVSLATRQAIASQGAFKNGNAKSIFVLAIGTNDIYGQFNSNTPDTYQSNLRTIANYLLGLGHYVVLTVPAKTDENLFPPRKAQHSEYKTKLYDLAVEINCPVIDFSTIDMVANGWYDDGIHPNDQGHFMYAKYVLDALGLAIFNSKVLTKYTKTYELGSGFFYDATTDCYRQRLFGIPKEATIVQMYVKNKNNGFMTPYQNCVDYANNKGLWYHAHYDGNHKIWYKNGGSPINIPTVFASLISSTLTDNQLVVEYIV